MHSPVRLSAFVYVKKNRNLLAIPADWWRSKWPLFDLFVDWNHEYGTSDEMPFGLWAWVSPRNHVLDGSSDFPMEMGNYKGTRSAGTVYVSAKARPTSVAIRIRIATKI